MGRCGAASPRATATRTRPPPVVARAASPRAESPLRRRPSRRRRSVPFRRRFAWPNGSCPRDLDSSRDRDGLPEPLTFLATELVDVRLNALAVRRVQHGDEFLPLLAERVWTPFFTDVAATQETVGGGVGHVEREAGELGELAHRGRAVVSLERE